MLLVYSKIADQNIISISSTVDADADLYFSTIDDFAGCTISFSTNTIFYGDDDITITFANSDAMKPYIDQMLTLDGFLNPAVDSLQYPLGDVATGTTTTELRPKSTNVEADIFK